MAYTKLNIPVNSNLNSVLKTFCVNNNISDNDIKNIFESDMSKNNFGLIQYLNLIKLLIIME